MVERNISLRLPYLPFCHFPFLKQTSSQEAGIHRLLTVIGVPRAGKSSGTARGRRQDRKMRAEKWE
jgi:hypothetical protein